LINSHLPVGEGSFDLTPFKVSLSSSDSLRPCNSSDPLSRVLFAEQSSVVTREVYNKPVAEQSYDKRHEALYYEDPEERKGGSFDQRAEQRTSASDVHSPSPTFFQARDFPVNVA